MIFAFTFAPSGGHYLCFNKQVHHLPRNLRLEHQVQRTIRVIQHKHHYQWVYTRTLLNISPRRNLQCLYLTKILLQELFYIKSDRRSHRLLCPAHSLLSHVSQEQILQDTIQGQGLSNADHCTTQPRPSGFPAVGALISAASGLLSTHPQPGTHRVCGLHSERPSPTKPRAILLRDM